MLCATHKTAELLPGAPIPWMKRDTPQKPYYREVLISVLGQNLSVSVAIISY